jgi:transposase
MSQDDVLFGYRLQLFDLAGRIGVRAACRTFGVHRSTYYRWRRRVERHGLGALRPRERRRPQMPNQLSGLMEERIIAFALGHPGLGPRRIGAELARTRWGGLRVSPSGVWRCLPRRRGSRPGAGSHPASVAHRQAAPARRASGGRLCRRHR